MALCWTSGQLLKQKELALCHGPSGLFANRGSELSFVKEGQKHVLFCIFSGAILHIFWCYFAYVWCYFAYVWCYFAYVWCYFAYFLVLFCICVVLFCICVVLFCIFYCAILHLFKGGGGGVKNMWCLGMLLLWRPGLSPNPVIKI